MKKSFAIVALLFAGSLTGCQTASASLAQIEIYDRAQNTVLPVYWHQGKRYVVGNPGHEYTVTVRNSIGQRVLAVVSVDGVNAISGETAAAAQSGYVIDGWSSLNVSGWRKNMERTAAFYFTSLGDSYAARTGRPGNVGVIGVALYKSRETPPPAYIAPSSSYAPARPGYWPEASAESRRDAPAREEPPNADLAKSRVSGAPTAQAYTAPSAPPASSPLGTGHGRSENSQASYVEFERATSYPQEVLTLYYDSYDNLRARGVIPRPWRQDASPQPFPGGFAPDPR